MTTIKYKPAFNSVLVEIDTEDSKWGTGNDDSMLGADYSTGKVMDYGIRIATKDYPVLPEVTDFPLKHSNILWNKGHEAGTEFEHDGKQYAFIYWFDIRGYAE